MKDKFIDTIIATAIPAIAMACFNFFLLYFFDNSSVLNIGQSTKMVDQYVTPINIEAHGKIDKLRITLPGKLTDKQISTNKPIQVKTANNNVGYEDYTDFYISKITSKSSVQLIINTDKPLENNDIAIDKNGNNISVNYESTVKNPAFEQLRSIILNAVVYFILFSIIISREKRDRKKKTLEIKEGLDILKSQNDKLVQDQNNTIERVKKAEDDAKKRQLLLQAKLHDYKKELSFWRNTIRKMLYKMPDGDKKAEKLIESVTDSLKTYNTNEKNEHEFETLKVAAALLRDSEEKS
ncbi:hypothetical protein ACX3X3_13740 [Bacillus subtilis]|uniref:hypothetical protein n=1 Tax=Bacillus subtilis TaxID=1423 RepID=UPI0011CAE14D|nr:hypothetical protein [Bacillus subtilis]TXK63743.1 hypothetical protein FVD40_05200 [Bacillus subtilis]HEQ3553603.1 hypothetical protein [Enterococcus faecalis]